jgi:hypothetical protein
MCASSAASRGWLQWQWGDIEHRLAACAYALMCTWVAPEQGRHGVERKDSAKTAAASATATAAWRGGWLLWAFLLSARARALSHLRLALGRRSAY